VAKKNKGVVILKKVGIALVLSTVVAFGAIGTSASAATDQSQTENVKEEIQNFSAETDNLEVINKEDLPEGTPVINFDSVEDFKKAVKEMETLKAEENTNEINIDSTDTSSSDLNKIMMTAAATTKSGSATIKWYEISWNPINFKYDTQMYIDFDYKYTGSGSKKKFSKVTDIQSGNGGFPMNWNQSTKGTYNFYDSNRGVKISITGYYLLGVNVGGQTVGTKFHDSFTKSYHF